METQMVNIKKIKVNPNNPRIIKDAKFKKLVKSIKEFPEMLQFRSVLVNEDNVILGGNMRYRACVEAGHKQIPVQKYTKDFHLTTDAFLNHKKSYLEICDEIIIKDNSSFGEWDWDILANNYEPTELENWGVDVPTIKNTELLSGLKYEPIYYEPDSIPNLELGDCLDLTKYNAKVSAIEESNVSEEQKDILKMFAYRFIKIDFESIANYYHFNATDDEQKIIERLRLVVTDDGIDGFIEDDLLKILNLFQFSTEQDD